MDIKELGLPEKYEKVVLQLYATDTIFDYDNIDKDILDDILQTYEKEDYSIKLVQSSEEEDFYVVSIPMVYGSPETTITENYLVFCDGYVKPTEFYDESDRPIYNYDGEEDSDVIDVEATLEDGWVDINDIDAVEAAMMERGM